VGPRTPPGPEGSNGSGPPRVPGALFLFLRSSAAPSEL